MIIGGVLIYKQNQTEARYRDSLIVRDISKKKRYPEVPEDSLLPRTTCCKERVGFTEVGSLSASIT